MLFRDLPQALCQIKTSMSITMPLWSSSPNLRQKLSVQRAQQDQAVLSGMGLVSWYFVMRHHLMIFSSILEGYTLLWPLGRPMVPLHS